MLSTQEIVVLFAKRKLKDESLRDEARNAVNFIPLMHELYEIFAQPGQYIEDGVWEEHLTEEMLVAIEVSPSSEATDHVEETISFPMESKPTSQPLIFSRTRLGFAAQTASKNLKMNAILLSDGMLRARLSGELLDLLRFHMLLFRFELAGKSRCLLVPFSIDEFDGQISILCQADLREALADFTDWEKTTVDPLFSDDDFRKNVTFDELARVKKTYARLFVPDVAPEFVAGFTALQHFLDSSQR